MPNLDKAISWLKQNGRPLDVALVEFERSSLAQPVIEELTAYTNADGGFGQALEPDVRLNESSVLATTVALQILSRCDQPGSNLLVTEAMGYLKSTFDTATDAWPIVPAKVEDAAHAPWWVARPASECLINPRAEIVGYMYRWPEFCDLNIREQLTGQLMEALTSASSLEMHDLLVFDRLVNAQNFPMDHFEQEVQHFYDLAASAISTNPSEWAEYGLTPLTLIDNPMHKLAPQFHKALQQNLDYLSNIQNEAGYWSPSWSWFGSFADEWPKAEMDIQSFVTRETINLFRRFD